MIQDIRYAFRQIRKSPGFSAIAILALALGIGANTAIFSVINSVFLQPLPYAEPERIVRLASTLPEFGLERGPFSYTRYETVRNGQQVFSDIAVGAFTGFVVTGRGDPEQVPGFHVSANYLDVLGVTPALGRNFNAQEDSPGGPDVVMLSHTYWQQHHAGSKAALGSSVTIDGRPHAVIGVLPPALSEFPLNQVGLWVPRPKSVSYLVPAQLDNGVFSFQVIARLKPGVTLEAAQTNLSVLEAAYRQEKPRNVDAKSKIEAVLLLEDLVGNQRRTYLMLFGTVGCVLLIACANVANLLLARFAGRRKEIALRFALGARRGQIVRQLLVESTLVAACGAALGLLLARWGLDTVVALGDNLIPRAQEIAVDWRAMGFTALIALVTGIGMGLVPALQAAAHDVNDTLKESSRGSSGGVAQGRVRNFLVVAEIALSLVLLVAAGLLLTSFARLQRVSPGFNPEGVFVGQLNISPTKYNGTKLPIFYQQLYERLRQLPGVRSASMGDRIPLLGNGAAAPMAIEGRPLAPMGERASANRHLITPGYFATLGVALKQGRDFNERDNHLTPHVVIVNESFVKQHFPNENPIGRRLITGMAQIPSEIVGVVADIRATNLNTAPEPDYYLPALQRPENFTAIMLRTEGDPAGYTAAVRAALSALDPDLPLLQPQPLTTLIAANIADRRLVMNLLAGFAALALLLASIGIYSVMAYMVSQRTSEIGIRMALGASGADVLKMVVGQGMRLALIGIALGVVAALGITRIMQQQLFEVQAHDPLIYAAIAFIIGAVAALACWIPARRAARTDPMIALRAE